MTNSIVTSLIEGIQSLEKEYFYKRSQFVIDLFDNQVSELICTLNEEGSKTVILEELECVSYQVDTLLESVTFNSENDREVVKKLKELLDSHYNQLSNL